MSIYDRMEERYRNGSVPWDEELPPPEVIEILSSLPPGKALDLGCGYGRASIYLAQQGWQVDGIDFVPQAVSEAVERAKTAGVNSRIQFHTASVADLDFLSGPYDFALDVGCMHTLDEAALERYASGLRCLLRPGAIYLLFARLRQPGASDEDGPRGLPVETIGRLFAEDFELEKYMPGETQVTDHPVWESAWFYFRRL